MPQKSDSAETFTVLISLGTRTTEMLAVILRKNKFSYSESFICSNPCHHSCSTALNQPESLYRRHRHDNLTDRQIRKGRWEKGMKREKDGGKLIFFELH